VIVLDGSMGEGGGQILRTALGLSAVTGRPFRIEKIRARRSKPGLLRQHLAGVRAVAALCGAAVEGAELGSTRLTFAPGPVGAGVFRADIGSAGSCGLVLQALLPALLHAAGEVTFHVTGGTHNDASPPAPFLEHALLPLLRRMGTRLDVDFVAAGFYPAGGGEYVVRAGPSALRPLVLDDEGPAELVSATALSSNLPGSIGRRELEVCAAELGVPADRCHLRTLPSPGPGNVVVLVGRRGSVHEVFTGFGAKGLPAEEVARAAGREWRAWADGGAPVGEHLADQLLVPCALAAVGGGASEWITGPPSPHTTTNAGVVAAFLPVHVAIGEVTGGRWRVRVEQRV
jgi:RNA 3'-terminal phosphate cyclase (ATP)